VRLARGPRYILAVRESALTATKMLLHPTPARLADAFGSVWAWGLWDARGTLSCLYIYYTQAPLDTVQRLRPPEKRLVPVNFII
jgi:hypothetical protein